MSLSIVFGEVNQQKGICRNVQQYDTILLIERKSGKSVGKSEGINDHSRLRGLL